jgi:hypothetical protein
MKKVWRLKIVSFACELMNELQEKLECCRGAQDFGRWMKRMY